MSTTVARVNRVLVALAVAGLLTHIYLSKPGGLLGMAVISLPVVIVGIVRRSWRESVAWVAYLLAILAFISLRGIADDFGFPVRVEYAISIERALFLGAVPSVWLQDWLYTGVLGPLEWAMIWTHVSYFIVPHLLAFGLLVYRPRSFVPFLAAIVVTYYAAYPLFVLLPTAPPWMAAETGALEPITRIVQIMLGSTGVQDSNPVAAMPSLHTAATVIVALALAQFGSVASAAGWAYVALMVFALTYLGEHYVVDAIAGALLAVGCWLAVGRLARAHDLRARPRDQGHVTTAAGSAHHVPGW